MIETLGLESIDSALDITGIFEEFPELGGRGRVAWKTAGTANNSDWLVDWRHFAEFVAGDKNLMTGSFLAMSL